MTSVVVLISVIILSPCAHAKKEINQQVDMAKYTCGDLLSEKQDDAGIILIWLDGYLSGKTDDTTIDMKFLGEMAEAVGSACRDNPNGRVLKILQDLTGQ